VARLLDGDSIRAITFDLYDTLFDERSIVDFAEQGFPGKGERLVALWQHKRQEYAWLTSLMERYEDSWKLSGRALEFAAKSLGISLDAEQKEALLRASLELEPFPEAAQALNDLNSYRLAILTNASPPMFNPPLGNSGFADSFDAVFSSHEVQTYMPDPRVYRLAERKLGLVPERLLLVSAQPCDVNGAKSCGMQACWVNRKGAQWNGLGFVPDMTVGDLRELVEIVNA